MSNPEPIPKKTQRDLEFDKLRSQLQRKDSQLSETVGQLEDLRAENDDLRQELTIKSEKLFKHVGEYNGLLSSQVDNGKMIRRELLSIRELQLSIENALKYGDNNRPWIGYIIPVAAILAFAAILIFNPDMFKGANAFLSTTQNQLFALAAGAIIVAGVYFIFKKRRRK